MISTDAASQVDRWFELPTAIEFPARIFKLESGLTVIHQEISATAVVVLDVWVQAISSCFSLQRQSGLFMICAWLDPQQLESVEMLICDYLRAVNTTAIAAPELDRCKRFLGNDYAFSTESPSQLAGLHGYYSTIAQVDLAATYPHPIQRFTPEELQDLAYRYLS